MEPGAPPQSPWICCNIQENSPSDFGSLCFQTLTLEISWGLKLLCYESCCCLGDYLPRDALDHRLVCQKIWQSRPIGPGRATSVQQLIRLPLYNWLISIWLSLTPEIVLWLVLFSVSTQLLLVLNCLESIRKKLP